MEHENKKRKEMRYFILFIIILVVINFVFNLNLSHYIWVILFFLVCILSLIQVIDTKIRFLDKRVKELENKYE